MAKNWQDYSALGVPLVLTDDDLLVRDKSDTTDHASEGTVHRGSLAAVLGSLNHICQGRLTMSTGNPIYNPQPITPSSTDTTAETLTFAAPHGWTRGTLFTPVTTGSGLTAGTLYVANVVSSTVLSVHNTIQTATGGTGITNLTGNVTSQLTPFGVGTNFLYFTPHNGNLISLYDGTRWKLYTFSEITLALSGLVTPRPHDAFIYDNAGTLTLELTAWTDDTTRATALVLQDGVWVKSGATTRRYVGTVRTIFSNAIEDSWSPPAGTTPKRFLWNHYNRVPLFARAIENADSWSYTSSTWRAANNDTTNRIEFVVGMADALVNARLAAQVYTPTAHAMTAIGVDSTSEPSGEWMQGYLSGGSLSVLSACTSFWSGALKAGYHYLQWLECMGGGSGTPTFYGDNGGLVQNGLRAEIMG